MNADTFVQDFSVAGNDTITDFNPAEDVIDFKGVSDADGITVNAIDGGTLIDAGNGNSLTIEGVTPEQLGEGNITFDGQAFDASPNSNLKSILADLEPAEGESAAAGDNDDGFDVRTQIRGNFTSANTIKTGGEGDAVYNPVFGQRRVINACVDVCVFLADT